MLKKEKVMFLHKIFTIFVKITFSTMLTVYKASAGSGKTFRLAVDYIERLIVNESNFEHILAVTFTNKATEEMKMRILSQLYGLAHRLKDSNNYRDIIIKELQEKNRRYPFTQEVIDEAYISRKAAEALQRMLHNYNMFRVETIDRFFQTVLRNLARELDLTPNLRVELGDKEVEHAAVDTWIDRLRENDRELNWILDYVHSSMDEERSWNIISKIKEFGETLFSDDYKQYADVINNKLSDDDNDFYTQYTKTLRTIIDDSNKTVKSLGEELQALMEQSPYDIKDFTQGQRGVAGFISRMATEPLLTLTVNSYTAKAMDPDDTEADNWHKKKCAADLAAFCRDTIRPRFIQAMKIFDVEYVKAHTATVTLKNMSKLRLLRAIQKEIEESNKENDRFLLSDTQLLLSRMIQDSDAPFIFEKIGSRIQNIMIDEFQDTSRIQWQNFKVLLEECMSHSGDNLIVGDVKQSIYRWRSGDWRLLNDIDKDFSAQQINIKTLNHNFRSSTRVIDFNNAFFKQATEEIKDDIGEYSQPLSEAFAHAYADVAQLYPEGKEPSGCVSVHLFDKPDYQEDTLSCVCDTIQMLLDKGHKQSDIAILVRSNSSMPMIASYCNTRLPKVKIISDEAYLLAASPALNIIIDALQCLVNDNNPIIRHRLSVLYQRYVLNSTASSSTLLSEIILPDKFVNRKDSLISMSLYELCEELYRIFDLHKMNSQNAYICAFFDYINEYTQKSVSDINGLITHWKDVISSKKVESDSSDGVRIMSIHKSKGLEFRDVILPFTDWKLEIEGNILWCQPDEHPFDELPVIPLNYGKSRMIRTIYEDDYYNEHMQNTVDNINLLYVAQTRASENLFIMTQAGQGTSNRGHLIQDVLPVISETLGATMEDNVFTYGDIPEDHAIEEESTEPTRNVFLGSSENMTIDIRTSSSRVEFKESNQSHEFTLDEDDTNEEQRLQYIKLGNVIHHILSDIRTTKDIPSAILRMQMEGLLFGQDITAEALEDKINRMMDDKTVSSWFAEGWQIYNECTILEYDKSEQRAIQHRPDRVITNGEETIVIDFKLSQMHTDYKDQVRRYMRLLSSMGHRNVRGYLLFVMTGRVVSVSL